MFVVMCTAPANKRYQQTHVGHVEVAHGTIPYQVISQGLWIVRAMIQKGFSMAQIMVIVIHWYALIMFPMVTCCILLLEDLSFRGVVTGCPFLMRHQPCQIWGWRKLSRVSRTRWRPRYARLWKSCEMMKIWKRWIPARRIWQIKKRCLGGKAAWSPGRFT